MCLGFGCGCTPPSLPPAPPLLGVLCFSSLAALHAVFGCRIAYPWTNPPHLTLQLSDKNKALKRKVAITRFKGKAAPAPGVPEDRRVYLEFKCAGCVHVCVCGVCVCGVCGVCVHVCGVCGGGVHVCVWGVSMCVECVGGVSMCGCGWSVWGGVSMCVNVCEVYKGISQV